MDIKIEDPAKEEELEDPSESGADATPEEHSADGEVVEVELDSVAEDDEEPEEVKPSLQAEVEKWRNLALRNQADLENYRKRMAREKSEAVQFANVNLLRSLLPALDNFEMGLMAAKSEGEESIIYQGMAMVKKQIDEFLSDEGVETIESIGARFDPNVHEAIQQEFCEDEPEGAIIGELRRGYRLGERLLRPANVIVSKGPQPEGEGEEDEAADA